MEIKWLVLLLVLVLGYLLWSRRPRQGLRILMYHKLDKEKADFLTVKLDDFENQIQWLLAQEYHILSFSDLLDEKHAYHLPAKSVILTFDDGYHDNYEYLLPILRKYHLKATIFLPVGFIGKHNEWDKGNDPLMDWETLKRAHNHFEYGYHSFSHRNMVEMSLEDFKQDLEKCLEVTKANNLDVLPVLAYPYGRFIRNKMLRRKYDQVLKNLGFLSAVRIGNTINPYPMEDKMLLCRLDIRGTDNLAAFQSKVRRGKFKIF